MRFVVVIAAAALLAGCGYVGDPLPPSLNIPQPVKDLTALERADKILVQFTIPPLTTDGVVLRRLGQVDLRAGEGGGEPFEVEKWAAQARRIPTDISAPGNARVEIPARDWAGREIIIGVRISGPKGRFSEWSNLIAQQVVTPLEAPAPVKAEGVPEGVRVSWQTPRAVPGLEFRVYRNFPSGRREEIGTAETASFVDTKTEYGKTYEYSVQSVLKSGNSVAESDLSGVAAVTPADHFPPAVPTGLSAIPAVSSIELNWDRNTEPDLKGYYVYRATDGEFQRMGGLRDTPSFSDRQVEPGKQYRYAVSAIDRLGNESERSAPLEILTPH